MCCNEKNEEAAPQNLEALKATCGKNYSECLVNDFFARIKPDFTSSLNDREFAAAVNLAIKAQSTDYPAVEIFDNTVVMAVPSFLSLMPYTGKLSAYLVRQIYIHQCF